MWRLDAPMHQSLPPQPQARIRESASRREPMQEGEHLTTDAPAYRSVGRMCGKQLQEATCVPRGLSLHPQPIDGIRLRLALAAERSSSVWRDTRRSGMNSRSSRSKAARNDSHSLLLASSLHSSHSLVRRTRRALSYTAHNMSSIINSLCCRALMHLQHARTVVGYARRSVDRLLHCFFVQAQFRRQHDATIIARCRGKQCYSKRCTAQLAHGGSAPSVPHCALNPAASAFRSDSATRHHILAACTHRVTHSQWNRFGNSNSSELCWSGAERRTVA